MFVLGLMGIVLGSWGLLLDNNQEHKKVYSALIGGGVVAAGASYTLNKLKDNYQEGVRNFPDFM